MEVESLCSILVRFHLDLILAIIRFIIIKKALDKMNGHKKYKQNITFNSV